MTSKLAFMVPTSNVHVSSTGVSSSQCAMHIELCRAALLSASCHKEGLQDSSGCAMLTGIKSTCFRAQGGSRLLFLVGLWAVVNKRARCNQQHVQQHLAVPTDLLGMLRTDCSGGADTRRTQGCHRPTSSQTGQRNCYNYSDDHHCYIGDYVGKHCCHLHFSF